MPVLKNAKHEAVAQAFIASKERVGWKAYKAVYPKSSQHAAETAWSRLLKDAEFEARIAELENAIADKVVEAGVMSRVEVLQELSNLGRANMADYVHIGLSDNVVEDVQQLPREQSAAIQEVIVESYQERDPAGADGATRTVKKVKFKLHGKREPLRDLGQHYKLFTEKLEIDDKSGLGEKLEAALRRASAGGPGGRTAAKERKG